MDLLSCISVVNGLSECAYNGIDNQMSDLVGNVSIRLDCFQN